MKIKYILGSNKSKEVVSDFVPLVGDCISFIGCNDIPNYLQVATIEVVQRSYNIMDDTVYILLAIK